MISQGPVEGVFDTHRLHIVVRNAGGIHSLLVVIRDRNDGRRGRRSAISDRTSKPAPWAGRNNLLRLRVIQSIERTENIQLVWRERPTIIQHYVGRRVELFSCAVSYLRALNDLISIQTRSNDGTNRLKYLA